MIIHDGNPDGAAGRQAAAPPHATSVARLGNLVARSDRTTTSRKTIAKTPPDDDTK
jgi:hypothetical protein